MSAVRIFTQKLTEDNDGLRGGSVEKLMDDLLKYKFSSSLKDEKSNLPLQRRPPLLHKLVGRLVLLPHLHLGHPCRRGDAL